MECLQLLGRRIIRTGVSSNPELYFGDAVEPHDRCGWYPAFHRNGNLLRWEHAEPDKPSNLDLVKHVSGHDHFGRSGVGTLGGHNDGYRNAVCGLRRRDARRAVRALVITTAALPNGVLNTAYSATLSASGGTAPYNSWSIFAGSLPTGLSINSGSGAITGTPTALGTFNFTARVSDSSNPIQSTTKALSITITASSTKTIWPSSTVPAVVDGGPDSAVQLGVKVRSDVAGTIRGIRFYKASTNTGTHVGSLWSITGTLLATATFTGETASGWQQVDFPTPVAINANTVYVASYHTTTGHYSVNSNYFASSGADNAPLHAPATGVVGGNGVFRYGASNVFPNQTWTASNYWVDVVFQPN